MFELVRGKRNMEYKAFMSYSHAVDGRLAPALETALKRFAKPWYRLRAMRIFRGKSTLAVTSALWPAIEAGLKQSEFFLLLANPSAAASRWVDREVAWCHGEQSHQPGKGVYFKT